MSDTKHDQEALFFRHSLKLKKTQTGICVFCFHAMIYVFLKLRITIQAMNEDNTATETLETIMTMPTLACPKSVQFCRNQKTGIRKTNTLARLMIRVSLVSPRPYSNAMTDALMPRGTAGALNAMTDALMPRGTAGALEASSIVQRT